MSNRESKRAAVFIDGSNFYFKLRALTDRLDAEYRLINFNYTDFCSWLVLPHNITKTRYYIGAVKQQSDNETARKLYADQQRLFRRLSNHNVEVIVGNLIQNPDKTYHEKGVDVRLSVEMIRYARQDEYDLAYLLSSDTDLVPAVEEVQSFGKAVNYVGISKGQSYGLSKVSNEVRLLRSEEVEPFLTLR